MRCDFRTVGEATYCLPLDRVLKTSLYADAQCEQPLTDSAPATATAVIDARETGVYHATSEYVGPTFLYSVGFGCHAGPPCENNCSRLGAVPDDEYVTGVMW